MGLAPGAALKQTLDPRAKPLPNGWDRTAPWPTHQRPPCAPREGLSSSKLIAQSLQSLWHARSHVPELPGPDPVSAVLPHGAGGSPPPLPARAPAAQGLPIQTSPNCPLPSFLRSCSDSRGISHTSLVLTDRSASLGIPLWHGTTRRQHSPAARSWGTSRAWRER